MRVIYFGTSDFAVPALRAIADHVILVVTQPDRPKGRGHQLTPSPVAIVASELGLPIAKPERARDPDFVASIESLDADVLVVAAYGQILSERLLSCARRGGINLHGSILPKYRGAAPIQRAILEGESETGVTLMQMAKGMDSGDIIAIEKIPITPTTTSGSLQGDLAYLAANMIQAWLPNIVAGDYPRTPQNHEDATFAPKIDKQETILQFDEDASVAERRFRAFVDERGASLETRFGLLKLKDVRLGQLSGEPGQVLARDPLTLGFSVGSLEFHMVQPAGRAATRGTDWLNGLQLRTGANLRPESVVNDSHGTD